MTISLNAHKTAEWWTNQLGNPSAKLNSGSGEESIHLHEMDCAQERQFTEPQLRVFRESLAQKIESELTTNQDCFSITFDYGPDRTLQDAAELAGILIGDKDLPRKMSTYTSGEEVTLLHGLTLSLGDSTRLVKL